MAFSNYLINSYLIQSSNRHRLQWEALQEQPQAQEFWLLMNEDWDICSYNCDWSKLDYI